MITKPKARKYRIRRTAQAAPQDPMHDGSTSTPVGTPEPDNAPSEQAQDSMAQDADTGVQNPPISSDSPQPEVDIEAIRNEGLTGRQLRMARRIAQRHNLAPASDFDAVRLLRLEGIDPFKRPDLLELVSPGAATTARSTQAKTPPPGGENARIQLPQTVPAGGHKLPSTELSPAERRANEITEIQRDIVRRRRRKIALLLTRLSFFVILPAFLAGWYFYVIATPMYATKSEFLILQADNAGGSGLGGLLSGTQFATNQDSIAVQSYLQSKDAMLRLDEDAGFEEHFTQESLDPIQRLDLDPSAEEAYKTYKKNVKIGYDPTEGVIRMEVIAADPELATLFSKKLIAYAEDRVNNLSLQKRGDQMKDARESFENALEERRAAQENLVTLQQQGAILDPEGVILGLRGQINSIELQLLEKELQLAALLDNARPNQSRVDGARGDVRRLEDQLKLLNAKMTDASEGENSLAQLTLNIQMAQADIATRDLLLQSALQSMEQTRMEASRQVRYLTISVEPIPSEDPSYPRAFENTILAFLIFGGIYLMISITASILREQVTS